MLCFRLFHTVKNHPTGAIPVKLTWLGRTVVRCVSSPDINAMLAPSPDPSTARAAPTATSVSTANARESAESEESLSLDRRPGETSASEEVSDTQDVIALLMRDGGGVGAGRQAGEAASGRGKRWVGQDKRRPFRQPFSIDMMANAADTTFSSTDLSTDHSSLGGRSVLNKRRRVQKEHEPLKAKKKASSISRESHQSPPESEVSVCMDCAVLFVLLSFFVRVVINCNLAR